MKIQAVKSSHKHYGFIEELMSTAFPQQERRDFDALRQMTDNNPLFFMNLILANEEPVGMISYWNFKGFSYVEHFAISPQKRNYGYGKKTLDILKKQLNGPIVLEVEEPLDEMTQRRISFYQREGFVLQDYPYLQPPYRPGEAWFPLKLMIYGQIEAKLDTVRDTLHKEVYLVKA